MKIKFKIIIINDNNSDDILRPFFFFNFENDWKANNNKKKFPFVSLRVEVTNKKHWISILNYT